MIIFYTLAGIGFILIVLQLLGYVFYDKLKELNDKTDRDWEKTKARLIKFVKSNSVNEPKLVQKHYIKHRFKKDALVKSTSDRRSYLR